jgi:hypothetical protein
MTVWQQISALRKLTRTNPDTDGDGVSDGVEVGIYEFFSGGDADSDGLRDALDTDSDGDGASDGAEDLNADGFPNANECDPIISNTDGVSADDFVGAEGFADTDNDGFVELPTITTTTTTF